MSSRDKGREGWLAMHPTSNAIVCVVPAAYCELLELENAELRAQLEKLNSLRKYLCLDILRGTVMPFNPATGKQAEKAFTPASYREQFNVAWLYNPWTGKPRLQSDINTDSQGLMVLP